jgi:hypothetical protein
MRRVLKSLILIAACAVVWAPAQARAEGYLSPWGGVNFGSDINNGRAAVGVNAGFMGAGVLGAEVAFGYSPHFFGAVSDFGNNTVVDLMGNLVLGIPIGGTSGLGLRPYVSAGAGIIRTQIDHGNTVDFHPIGGNSDFGLNGGAGVTGYVSNHFGLRGDIRYFKDNSSPSFHYWRLSAGIVLR